MKKRSLLILLGVFLLSLFESALGTELPDNIQTENIALETTYVVAKKKLSRMVRTRIPRSISKSDVKWQMKRHNFYYVALNAKIDKSKKSRSYCFIDKNDPEQKVGYCSSRTKQFHGKAWIRILKAKVYHRLVAGKENSSKVIIRSRNQSMR